MHADTPVAYLDPVSLRARFAAVSDRLRHLPLGLLALAWAAYLFVLVAITALVDGLNARLSDVVGAAVISIAAGLAVAWTHRRRWPAHRRM